MRTKLSLLNFVECSRKSKNSKLWFLYKTEGEPKGMSIYGKANGILVSIQTRDGLHVRRGNLDYLGLVELVKKLGRLPSSGIFPVWSSGIGLLQGILARFK